MMSAFRTTVRIIAIAILVAAVAFVFAKRNQANKTTRDFPEDLVALVKENRIEEAQALKAERLQAAFGREVPDIALLDMGGQRVSLSAFKGRPVALVWLGRQCGFSRDKVKELQSAQWSLQGYETLVFVVGEGEGVPYPALEGQEHIYQTRLPMPEYLAYVTASPTLLFIDDKSRFVGYQFGVRAPVMFSGTD